MFEHYTVLKEETVQGVLNNLDGIYVDGTLGGGGHTKLLLSKLSSQAQVIAFDQDIFAIKENEKIKDVRLTLIHSNFKNLKQELNKIGIEKINGLILDLGFSSPQIDDEKRGFSYMHEGPLDMRMDIRQELTANYIVNNYSSKDLQRILKEFADEKYARQIAGGIVKTREIKTIDSTLQLVEIIENSIPMKARFQKGHSAKKTFQALRIEVNDELKALTKALDEAYEMLLPGGRLSIISFHSLEDKIVKYKYKKESSLPKELANLPTIPEEYLPKARIINNKPILPSEKENEENSRSASAKLRILEKL